ncbi:MAG: gamma-glutamyltransferase, partial [Rhodospirillaceae bacterium]|nr:gamma-glutamyltransferase [Rhodospirillaceae bacterium]
TGQKYMISTANPLAANAGLEILREGGSAVDAAIAAQMVLGLVEPQSSGIGGGGFMLSFNAKNGEIATWDGRETAPDGATADMFLDADKKPMAFKDARLGGLSVGVPGLLAMAEQAHLEQGKLPWARLFQRAIKLAEDGFIVSPRLAEMVAGADDLNTFKSTRDYFFHEDGTPIKAGEKITNKQLASTYRTIAEQGAKAFYLGSIGYDIGVAVHEAEINPGTLNGTDMVAYRAQKREPVCGPYRTYLICGMGPPSSGGIATLQILGMLQEFDLSKTKPGSLEAVHLVAEASKLAFADRATYIGDPRFVPWPEGLIASDYLKARAKEINPTKASTNAVPGMPGMTSNNHFSPSGESHGVSTTHLSVIDGDGNAVALTSSIESAFGSRLMVRGFLLNNQLTDFSFSPEISGAPVANQAGPRRRPRSSMAPTLIFDNNGNIRAAIGSPGGSSIIGYVTQATIALLDWKLSPNDALAMPHFLNRGDAVELEIDRGAEVLKKSLEAIGHQVKIKETNSGLHFVGVDPKGGLVGAADPRREGIAIGD